jgi:hypothetical protein
VTWDAPLTYTGQIDEEFRPHVEALGRAMKPMA